MISLRRNISSNTIQRAVTRHISTITSLSAYESTLVDYYIRHTIKLYKNLRNDGAIIPPSLSDYKTEFGKLTDIHQPVSMIYTNFLDLGGQTGHRLTSYNTPVTVVNPSNGEYAEFQKRDVILIQCWLYTTNCELILRLLKKFIDFLTVNNLLAHRVRISLLQPHKITLGTALNVLISGYNTYLFQDINCDLRNKISHYSFKFLNGSVKDGIYFNTNPANLRQKEIFSDERLSKLNRKISLLYAALFNTNYAMLFKWNGIN